MQTWSGDEEGVDGWEGVRGVRTGHTSAPRGSPARVGLLGRGFGIRGEMFIKKTVKTLPRIIIGPKKYCLSIGGQLPVDGFRNNVHVNF